MLIIYLPPVATDQWDYVISSDGLNVTHFSQTSAHQLPADSSELVVVLPWQVLSWHSVQFPPGSSSRKQAVLHSLLEESLLQDPQDTLTVTAPGSASVMRQGGSALVAVCSKAWLREALSPLQLAGLQVHRIVPELSPVAAGEPAQLYLLNQASHNTAVLCDAHCVWQLPTPGAAALQQATDLEVFAEPAAVSHSERWHPQPARLQTAAQRWLQASQSSWNLAQDEWTHNRRLRGWRWLQQGLHRLWFAAAWGSCRRGLLALLLVQLAGLNVWAWQQEAQWEQRQHSLVQMFRQSFPTVSTVIDPSLQMRRELQHLRQQAGQLDKPDMESMLAAMAAHWPDGVTPESVDYQPGELRLGGLSDLVMQQLGQQPWSDQGYQWQAQGRAAVLRSTKAP